MAHHGHVGQIRSRHPNTTVGHNILETQQCGYLDHIQIASLSTEQKARYNRQGRKANVGAGTATATEPTREHKQYATQGPTTYLCT